jgi:hypothetical protein
MTDLDIALKGQNHQEWVKPILNLNKKTHQP